MFAAPAAGAQDPVALHRLDGPITLDGLSDEPAWRQVRPLELTMYTPTFEAPLTERTEILIGYDDAYLYVAGRLYDSDPHGVRANTLYRDRYSGDDIIGVILDTYNDFETALWFATTPAGVRSDRSLSNNAEFTNGFPMNSDWNSFWDVATVQNHEGWFVEMRIPYTSLGFQDVDGHVEMGLIVYRFIARKNERQLYPAIPPDWAMGFAKPSQAQRVTLEGIHSRKPVYLTPYLLAGMEQSARLDTDSTAFSSPQATNGEVGGDLKYLLTSSTTLDLTVNTDFAQVEADDQQINLTRFSLFFPEKRQFFQERASTFEFNTGGVSRLFHSRQIGLDAGQPVRIYGGARLVGRIGGTDIGLLNMQTAESDGLASENFGVLRVRQRVLNSYSTVGVLGTSRLGLDGDYNFAVGVDALLRLFGDEYLTIKWAETWDRDDPSGRSVIDGARIVARWERRNQDGFSYLTDYVRSGSAYNPGLGFVTRRDFTQYRNDLNYKWFMGSGSLLRTFTIQSRMQAYLSNADNSTESASIVPSIELESKTGHTLTLSALNTFESAKDTFAITGVSIPPGDYWFHEAQLNLRASLAGKFRPDVTVSAGSFYDGTRFAITLGPQWALSRHLELSADYQFNALRFRDRDLSANTHLVRARVQTALDTHLSLSTFVQFNSTADDLSVNARLRYHFSEGRDLWLVYNEGFTTDRQAIAGLTPPASQNRTVMLKYTHTFIR